MINKNMLKIDKSKKNEAYGIPVGFEGHVINNILSINKRNVIYLAKDDKDAEIIRTSLLFFNSKTQIYNFPAWDCLPYDRSGPKLKIQSERLSSLTKLILESNVNKVIIATVNAITQRVIPRIKLQQLSFELTIGKSININELKYFFNSKISKHCFGVDINSHFEIDYAKKDFQLIKNFKNEL